MLIKTNKYYSPDAPEGGAPQGPPPPATAAEAMARSGRQVTEGGISQIATGTPIPERQATPEQQQAPPAAPATQEPAQQAEPAKTSDQEPAKAEPAKTEPPKVTEKSWQEVLKSQQPETVLRELGFDDNMVKLALGRKTIDPKMVSLIDTYETKGDVKEYLEALTTDYTKMSDAEVMKRQLQRDYPEFSKEELDVLYRKKVVEQYKLSEDYTDEERAEGAVLLKADTIKARQALLADQQQKLLTPPPEKAPVVDPVVAQRQQLEQQALSEYHSQLDNHPAAKEVLSTGKMSMGEGENKFYVEFPNPQETFDILKNDEKYGEALAALEPNHHLFVTRYIQDPEGVIRQIANHFMALGAKKFIDPIDNPSRPAGTQTPPPTPAFKTAAEAMAKGGTVRYS